MSQLLFLLGTSGLFFGWIVEERPLHHHRHDVVIEEPVEVEPVIEFERQHPKTEVTIEEDNR